MNISFIWKTAQRQNNDITRSLPRLLNHWSHYQEKKEDVWHSGMTKNPNSRWNFQKSTWQHKNATKNFNYTTITDRLRTVS